MSLREAAAAYGLDAGQLQPVASAYREAAAYRCGRLLLKPYRYAERQLYYITGALRHLQHHGFRWAPRLVATREGEAYLRTSQGSLWYATTWIAGRPPRFPAELEAAACSLAAFHRASEGCFIPYHPSRSWRRRWEGLLDDLLLFRRRAEAGAHPFDRAFARAAPRFIRQAEAAAQALGAAGYDRLEEGVRQRRAFCHRDLTAANLVVDWSGTPCLVDPDTWGPDLRLHDVNRLLLAGAGADPDAALGALRAYEATAPLDPAERRLLPWAYLLPREFWWAGVCRYRAPAPGVEPERLLQETIAGAPQRDACARALYRALCR